MVGPNDVQVPIIVYINGHDIVRPAGGQDLFLPARAPLLVAPHADFVRIGALVHLGSGHIQVTVQIEIRHSQRVHNTLDLRDDHMFRPVRRANSAGASYHATL